MKKVKLKAEKIVDKKAKKVRKEKPKKPVNKENEDISKLVHLLQVHQIELEHQNEELRIAQEELEVSRNKYVNLFDFSPVPYFTLNTNGIINEVNLIASKMIGVERSKLIGKHFNNYILAEDLGVFNNFIQTVFNSPEKHSCELKLRNNNKEVFQVLIEGLELDSTLELGKKCQLALIDLTKYKDIETSLKISSEELKLLNASKDKFFSIIAHDLRGPFQSLLGFSELLATQIESLSLEEIITFSKGLHSNLINVYGLLDNLLNWSLIQRNALEFIPSDFDLSDLVTKIAAVSNQGALKKNISIYNKIESGNFVCADINMIRTIIQNLITNAVKFTRPKGQIIINSVKKDKYIEVCVEDSGIGMDTEHISKLFKMDAIFSTNGTDGEKGTGLGLPLCKDFIERNGGRIWVESEFGKGSKFKFTLPGTIS